MQISGVSPSFVPRPDTGSLVPKPAALDSVQFNTSEAAGLIQPNTLVATQTPFPTLDSQGYRLDSLGGQNPAIGELKQLVTTLQNGQSAPFSSYLVKGSTGSGKTTLARSLAGELQGLGISSLHAEAADFTENGPQKLKQLFQEAQQAAARSPHKTCLVLIDDIDGIARVRSALPDQAQQVAAQVSGELSGVAGTVASAQLPPATDKSLEPSQRHQLLLTLSSQMEKNKNLILIGTTSRADTIDYEVSQRFERDLDCPTPSGPAERLSLLQAMTGRQNLQVDREVLEDMAAAATGGNPGSLEKGLKLAQVLGGGQITADSAREARLQIAFGVARPVTNPDWMVRLTICHEMGHVAVRHLFEEMAKGHPDQLPKGIDAVSFAPRGTANAAVFLKSTTNPASTFEWYLAEIASNLAGRTSEAVFGGGHLSSGPGSDIAYATGLAREAVREKAMGLTLGPRNAFSLSEQAMASQDEERIIKVSDQIATSAVEFYREFTEGFAQELLGKRQDLKALTISGRELESRLSAWEQADPQRAQRLNQLSNEIRQAIAAIKPAPSPGLPT